MPIRGAVQERAEKQRGEEDPDGGVAAEQGHGDAEEAHRARARLTLHVVDAEDELPAQDVDHPRQASEPARDRHREEIRASDVDAGVARGLGVVADGSNLVAERRSVEDDPVDDEHRDRDEEADVEALEDRVPPPDVEMRVRRDVVRLRQRPLPARLQRPLLAEQPAGKPEDDPVEHDRRDHLVGADRGPKEAGDPREPRPRQRAEEDRLDDVREARHARQRRCDPNADDRPGRVLALAADVEEAGPKGERYREARQDQRRRQQQGRLKVERRVDAVGV